MRLDPADLPGPPAGRFGWPWEAADGAPPLSTSRRRVTIVTPSFNQAAYLEATIRSVLLQGYAGLEYIVIDGGSSDGSREIIQRYAPYLDYWVSEPDRGQAHAINKGFARASGEIVAWLNSDDYYTPGAVARALTEFDSDARLDWLYGDCLLASEPGGTLTARPSAPFVFPDALRGASPIWQPSAFFKRSLLDRVGMLDERFELAMDYDLWLRAIRYTRPLYLKGTPLAVIADHPEAKSRRQLGEVVFESTRAVERFLGGPDTPAEAVSGKRATLGHLYFECAAACVLWRRSPAQALPWFLRAVGNDPRLLVRIPGLLGQLALFAARHGSRARQDGWRRSGESQSEPHA